MKARAGGTMNQYIIMKSSRSPASGIASATDAYIGTSCIDAQIPAGRVYLDLLEATADALKLKAINPVGWHIWALGSQSPLSSTEDNALFAGQSIPKICLSQSE